MVASFVLFIINIWRRGWTLPILGVGLWALIAVVAGAIYPQFVQRVQVEPNEPEKEQPYIARNIEATTAAMGLGDVEVTPFELETEPDAIDLAGNADTIRNIRIWDPSDNILGRTFQQLQGIRDYYVVNNVDVDRYQLNGEPTQVVLSVRDLNTADIPRKIWAAEHLTYTHGYGAIVAPANEKETSGEPSFVAEDIPYRTSADELELTQPAVYFGEDLGGYVVVGLEAARDQLRGRGRDEVHDLRGRGRRRARQRRQEGGLRAPLRRPQPADLRPAHRQTRGCSTSATSASGCRPWRRSSTSTPIRTP